MRIDSLRFAVLAVVIIACPGAFAACATTTPAFVPTLCDDPGPILVRGQETGFEFCTNGPVHRPRIQACPKFEHAPGQCDGGEMPPVSVQCRSNADCASFIPTDVCVPQSRDAACTCRSSCVNDSDCGDGKLCECGDPVSFCRVALCRIDAECGGGRLCVESTLDGCGVRGFACQNELDECLFDRDCPDAQICRYLTGHRVCGHFLCDR